MLFSMVPAVYADDAGSGTETETSAAEIDLNTFIKNVVAANYDYDGEGITVKWSPATGCSQLEREHDCTAGEVEATGNTPSRVNIAGFTQYQLFVGADEKVTIKNVNFVYVPAEVTLCANTGWAGTSTSSTMPAELRIESTGDMTIMDCAFDNVSLSAYGDGKNESAKWESLLSPMLDCKDNQCKNKQSRNCSDNNRSHIKPPSFFQKS